MFEDLVRDLLQGGGTILTVANWLNEREEPLPPEQASVLIATLKSSGLPINEAACYKRLTGAADTSEHIGYGTVHTMEEVIYVEGS